MSDLYRIQHLSPELKTVGEYVREIISPARQFINKEAEFLAIQGPDGRTNQQQIEALYTEQEATDNSSKPPASKLLKVPTTF